MVKICHKPLDLIVEIWFTWILLKKEIILLCKINSVTCIKTKDASLITVTISCHITSVNNHNLFYVFIENFNLFYYTANSVEFTFLKKVKFQEVDE